MSGDVKLERVGGSRRSCPRHIGDVAFNGGLKTSDEKEDHGVKVKPTSRASELEKPSTPKNGNPGGVSGHWAASPSLPLLCFSMALSTRHPYLEGVQLYYIIGMVRIVRGL